MFDLSLYEMVLAKKYEEFKTQIANSEDIVVHIKKLKAAKKLIEKGTL